MKSKFIRAHLDVARIYGDLSTADRLKVGCIIVKDDRIISIGYNGMPAGGSNVCEEDKCYKNQKCYMLKQMQLLKLAKVNRVG